MEKEILFQSPPRLRYHGSVTQHIRRRTYWVLFGISTAMLLVGAVLAIVLLGAKKVPIFLIERGIYKIHVIDGLRIPSLVVSVINVLALSLFAVIVHAFILMNFRTTVSAEIFFFTFWLAACSMEPLRLLHLGAGFWGGTDALLAAICRIYMGARFFGFCSIFISGLYAAGMRSEKQFMVVAISFGISVALASILPVNTGIWAWNLMFRMGYSRLIQGFGIAIIAITIADYLIAVRLRGDRSYYAIALGMAAVMAGTQLTGRDGSPLITLVSMAAMGAGSFVYIRKLHTFYLWQ